MTRFKELCMDTAVEGSALGEFWAAATGCSYAAPRSPGDPGDVVGDVEGMGIAICPVPEPKTVKNRVHWDVYGDVDELLSRGAVRLADQPRWTVLADPEAMSSACTPEGWLRRAVQARLETTRSGGFETLAALAPQPPGVANLWPTGAA